MTMTGFMMVRATITKVFGGLMMIPMMMLVVMTMMMMPKVESFDFYPHILLLRADIPQGHELVANALNAKTGKAVHVNELEDEEFNLGGEPLNTLTLSPRPQTLHPSP